MKTPWSNLLQYGVALAAMIVIVIAGFFLMIVIGVAVLISKFLVFIK